MSQTSRPVVSIIIPCYNQGHFLAEAIESILGQTYPNVEAIVVDDGSTDATPEVAGRYGDRIRYIRKENGGLSAARNTGILAAAGELVLFLDSDDYLRPNALEQHVEAVRAHPGAGVFHSAHQVIDREGRDRSWHEAKSLGPDPFHRLLEENRFPPNAHLIRRCAFARVGLFDTSLRASEDWDMWLRLAAANYEFVPVPGAVAVYRAYGGSMSRQYDRMWNTGLAVLRKSRAYHGPCSQCRQAAAQGVRRIRGWCFEMLVKELYAEKARAGARASLTRASTVVWRDPILAGWLGREFLHYLRGAHAHVRSEAPVAEAASG